MLKQDANFLIVDDYATIRETVIRQLKQMGFSGDFLEAENVDDAIEILSKDDSSIEFIMSDWNMPGKVGLDLLIWARAQPKYTKIPFIILTTENEQEKILTAIENGVSSYLIKPWTVQELAEKIKYCFEAHT